MEVVFRGGAELRGSRPSATRRARAWPCIVLVRRGGAGSTATNRDATTVSAHGKEAAGVPAGEAQGAATAGARGRRGSQGRGCAARSDGTAR